jgi:hypothetical protein
LLAQCANKNNESAALKNGWKKKTVKDRFEAARSLLGQTGFLRQSRLNVPKYLLPVLIDPAAIATKFATA